MSQQKPDWERIEAEYRAGQLSVREIARQNDVSEAAIRKKARTADPPWERDLSEQVRQAVRTELVRSEVRTDHVRTDDRQAVQAAAARGVEVVRQHQRRLGTLHALADVMAGWLAATLKGEATETGFRLGQHESHADVLVKLSGVVSKVIPLERKAFNLDDPAPSSTGQTTTNEQRSAMDPAELARHYRQAIGGAGTDQR